MGEIVSFASNGGTSEGYLATPAAPNGGAVILIQEWWGLVGHITDVADRYAAQGYLTLAPDLFHGAHTTEPDEAMSLLMGLAMDQAAKDIAGAAAYLAVAPGVTRPVCTVGYCMGGSLALWSATLSDQVAAAVVFYPAIPWERMSPQWSNLGGKSVMFHCSEGDGTTAAPGIQLAKQAIEAAGGRCELYDYPGTQHAFFNDHRPEVYDAAASAVAWQRTLEFLARSGK